MPDTKRRKANPIITTRRQLRDAYGAHFHGRDAVPYHWDIFFTGTIDESRRDRPATELAAAGEWTRFRQRIDSMAGRPGGVRYVRGIESVVDGHYHVHALIADVAGLSVDRMRKAWKAGQIAEFRRYDASRPGSLYVCFESALRENAEMLEFSSELPGTIDAEPVAEVVAEVAVEGRAKPQERAMPAMHSESDVQAAPPEVFGIQGLRVKLEAQRLEHARLGSMVSAAALLDAIIKDIDLVILGGDVETVTLAQAAALTGYHPDSIGRLIKNGRVHNYGSKRRPLVRLADLPRKDATRRRLLSVASVALPGETSPIDESVVGSIDVLDAIATRHGRSRPA